VTALLDTHAVIWCLEDSPELGRDARAKISRAEEGALAISDITLLEIAMLVSKGKLGVAGVPTTVLEEIAESFRVLPIDARIAAEAMELPLPQGDPFDRVIVATARRHSLPLITKDRLIVRSKLVPVVW
jgi:PIN domain nuclease of toxin-antitoxin system